MVQANCVDPPELSTFFMGVRQGHVFTLPNGSSSVFSRLPGGTTHAVVASQTCDVVLPHRPTVILAPLVGLDGDMAHLAALREAPQYVHLPLISSNQFADLGRLQAYDKADVFGLPYRPGVDISDDMEVRAFALAIGRWFSRFAVPDDVVPWLNPLVSIIREKYRKPNSALGHVLKNIVEVRIEAEKWSTRPLDLTLHVIVAASTIPTLDFDKLDPASMAKAYREGKLRRPSELAELLDTAETSHAKATFWPLFAESLARHCTPRQGELTPEVSSAVRSIVALLSEDDEFSLSRLRKSERLDVDYLSEPYPL
jgi:hypothetical protein